MTLEVTKNHIIQAIKNAKEHNLSATELESLIDGECHSEGAWLAKLRQQKYIPSERETFVVGMIASFPECPEYRNTVKIWLGNISSKMYKYLKSINKEVFTYPHKFDDDFVDEYMIWDCCKGFLVIYSGYEGLGTECADSVCSAIWYTKNYTNVSVRRRANHWEDGLIDLDMIETENFRTPYFMLHPSDLYAYLLRMGSQGYELLRDFEYRDVGWEYDDGCHDNDLFKYHQEEQV